jgi:hypothetical protein
MGRKSRKPAVNQMRHSFVRLAPLGVVFLVACSPRVPDSAAGVGFNQYNTYGARPVVQAPMTTGRPATFSAATAAAAIDRAAGAPGTPAPYPTTAAPTYQPSYQLPTYQPPAPIQVSQTSAGPTGAIDCGVPEGIHQTNSEMNPQPQGVSDEQDFQAVSGRETIESDKRRIECNRERYQVDQPGTVPQRQGDSGPNIAQYALSTSHAPGTQVYKRSGLSMTNPQRACAKFPSPDKAQEDFLRAGGPQRDRKGLDPDGDGFACDWDPRPFRAALQ